ncbi:14062_t:CDS:2 [Ambispora leptoticha]|uniref:14062_t:CDS:1 n=1 Tax=Ambispora leptoticha TaxID=144679 RepID=A0A9N9GK47_9GLOM|nr:14062_t:CDS:2 [Ambispora leptoticha]
MSLWMDVHITTTVIQALTAGEESIIHKRFSANSLCPQLGVGEKYCVPKLNDAFNSTQWITFAWNTLANPFAVQGALDIYLRRTQGTKIVETMKNVSNDLGQYSFKPQSGWFEPYDPQANNTFQFFFVAAPLNQDPNDITDSGPTFYITQLPPTNQSSGSTITLTAPTVTATTSPALSASNVGLVDSTKNSPLTTPIIVIIIVAAFLLLIAIAGLAFVILTRSRNRSKRHQSLSNVSTSSNVPMMVQTKDLDKGKRLSDKSGEPESPVEASSIYSTTPLATKNSMSSLNQKLGIVSFSSESNLLQPQQQPAFDAAMLSDAYRQVLRKPDWKEEDDDEEFDTEIGLSEEERRRRREAKEIMKQELAEEGRGLHSVQRRHTKVQVHKIDEDDEDKSQK